MILGNTPTPSNATTDMLFKRTKPLDVFFGGKRNQVENINVVSIADNLVDTVTFKYTVAMGDVGHEIYVGEGTVTVTPDDYQKWDASALGAYQLVCNEIGLELVEPLKLFEFTIETEKDDK